MFWGIFSAVLMIIGFGLIGWVLYQNLKGKDKLKKQVTELTNNSLMSSPWVRLVLEPPNAEPRSYLIPPGLIYANPRYHKNDPESFIVLGNYYGIDWFMFRTRETINGNVIYNWRSEEHTSELQSHHDIVCRL